MHPKILDGVELLEESRDERTIWEERYRSIVDLESHLERNGTHVVKIFLHLSQEEQRKRFLERIDEPEKIGSLASPTSKRESIGSNMPKHLKSA